MPRTALNPPSLFNSVQYGFSQITLGQGQTLVTFSGQVGWDEHEQIVAPDLRAQTMKALANLKIAVAAAGGSLDDVLSLRLYIVADVMDDSAAIRESLKTYFPTQPPTATWIGVPRLANRAFLVEIEALALLS